MHRFAEFSPALGLLFVDDGSTDGTGDFLEQHQPAGARCLRLDANLGKAEAVRAGMLAACRGAAADWIGYWDADLATPLSEVGNFLGYQRLHPERVDAVFGSRVYRLGARIERCISGTCTAGRSHRRPRSRSRWGPTIPSAAPSCSAERSCPGSSASPLYPAGSSILRSSFGLERRTSSSAPSASGATSRAASSRFPRNSGGSPATSSGSGRGIFPVFDRISKYLLN